jgi:hypothetical protein
MARTDLGKATEFARALGNLCSGQPITTCLNRFEPRHSGPKEIDDSRSGGSRGAPRGGERRGYGSLGTRTTADHRSGGDSGRSYNSHKNSSSASASKDSSIERNRPPEIRIPEGRIHTPEENPREKRARLSRPTQERLGPHPGAAATTTNLPEAAPMDGPENVPPPHYNLRNRIASTGESNETITTPSTLG